MDKKPLIVVSICAVVLLVLGSLSNVVGYQSVQTSQQNTIKERINQRELLFQIIVDIVNNKEIQRIILKSQMSRGIFPTSEMPVVTKTQIRQMYFIGLILSKVISKSRIQSMVGKYQFNNQETQKEISSVIEKDTIINSEITQLQDSECDCEKENFQEWRFPFICVILIILFYSPYIILVLIGSILAAIPEALFYLCGILTLIPWLLGFILKCWWAGYGPGTS
jgi:hypothetical protein